MNDKEKTLHFAQVLLKDRYPEFLENYSEDENVYFGGLLGFAEEHCHFMMQSMDWTGEDELEDSGAANFFNQILQSRGIEAIEWDYNEFEKIAVESDRGEYPPALFAVIDQKLKEVGQRVVFIDFGDDEYNYTALCESDFEALRYLTWDNMSIKIFGAEDLANWKDYIAKLERMLQEE